MSAQLTLQRHATGLFTAVTKRSTTTPTKDGIVIGLLAAALIGLIIADTTTTPESVRAATVSATAAPVQNVATFTGNYENGVPVYRLAPIEVTAVRVASAPR